MPAGRPPIALVIVAAVFVAFVALLVVQSLLPKRIETYALDAHPPRPPAPGRSDTVSLDVRDAARWHYVDLDRGVLLTPPDTQGWDLAARRFQLRVPSPTPPTSAAPAAPAPASRDLPRWYKYDFLAHLLRPRPQIYALRTDGGRAVSLEVLGYYCPGPTAGCLTLRLTPAP
jgi:hypothetical protein